MSTRWPARWPGHPGTSRTSVFVLGVSVRTATTAAIRHRIATAVDDTESGALLTVSRAWKRATSSRLHPAGDGPSDLVRRIFLHIVAPRDLHLGQRRQPADEGEILFVGEDCTGLGPEEQLGHTARRQPSRGRGHDLDHI